MRSGLWEGQSRTLIPVPNKDLKPDCQQISSHYPSNANMIPFTWTRFLVPEAAKQPHSMMLPSVYCGNCAFRGWGPLPAFSKQIIIHAPGHAQTAPSVPLRRSRSSQWSVFTAGFHKTSSADETSSGALISADIWGCCWCFWWFCSLRSLITDCVSLAWCSVQLFKTQWNT